METFIKIVGATVLVLLAIIFIAAIISLPVMLLWNWLVPVVIPGGQIAGHITWLQAWGLMVFCGFLFKSSSAVVKP
jgi:hypothetical protein